MSKIKKKAKKVFSCWLKRDLTIQGHVLLPKAEGISRVVYLAISLYVDPKTMSAIDSLPFKFICKNETEYVKRKTCVRSYSEGGFNALDFQTIKQIFKINWIKQCLSKNNCQWF